MDNIYFNCVLLKKIVVQSKYLNENIDGYINSYIKSKIENHCVHEGFVKEDSIKIIKKSAGLLTGSQFNGDITYEIAYNAQVCNPVVGNVIDCKVKFVNKLGLLGNNGPITIIVGKQFHSNNYELNKISENDIIKVEVIAKKFSLNDKEIKVIAKLWDNKKTAKKDLISSDLTPIISDNNDYVDIENNHLSTSDDENDEGERDEEEYSIDDEQDDDTVSLEEEVKVENPDENNLETDDIEIDESEDDNDSEDETNSVNEY